MNGPVLPGSLPPQNPAAVILALTPHAFSRLWGMTLVERLLRQMAEIGIPRATVVCAGRTEAASFLRRDFSSWAKIVVDVVEVDGDVDEVVRRTLAEAGNRALVVDGNVVVDVRVLEHLATAEQAVRFEAGESTVASLGANAAPGTQVVTTHALDGYLQKTRKHVVPYILPITQPDHLREAERTTFSAVYKGATDFITKWVFFHPTRWIVKAISPSSITPNQITLVSMVLSFGAIIPFFMGRYVEAVIMGFTMALLDTIDGKLARTTLRTSTSGDLLDHVSDTVYLLLWYVGLGWSLSDGRILDLGDPAARIHAVLLLAFVADKIITGLYKRIYGFELHDYTRLDYVARIFIARRNPFLVGMVIALVAGRPMWGIHIIAAWYVATFAFHLFRFIYIPLRGDRHQAEATP